MPSTIEEETTDGAVTAQRASGVSLVPRSPTPQVFHLGSAYDFSGRTLEWRYALVRKIGAGSFATVYLAHDLRMFGRKVAIKALHPEHGASPVNVERFVQEMKVAAKLDGPYRDRVVKIIDHGRCDRSPALLYFVMEFVDGITLHALLTKGEDGQRRRQPMPWPQAAMVIQELVKALATLHACGVVHRDIKPGNVIIEQKPDGDFLKLLDLGIAKVLPGHEISGDGPRTHPEFVLGTPRYMAPEQFTGECKDPRVDLYAAGIMLYEFITGDVPSRWYERPGAAHPYMPIPPSQAHPGAGIPPKLDAIVLKAIAFDPDARYQSADELAGVLAEILLAAEREQARERALSEMSSQGRPRARLPDGLRGAFAVSDLDAQGWVMLRWWVTIAMTGVAMCFVVAIAAAVRRDRMSEASLASAELQPLRIAKAPTAKRKPPVKAVPAVKPAAPPEPAAPRSVEPIPEPAAPRPVQPTPLPPSSSRPRPKVDEPPPILASSAAGVASGAVRVLRARCRGVKGRTMVDLVVDVPSAKLVQVEVAADAAPRLRACILRHAATAFQFAGVSKRISQYTFVIEL